MAEIFSLPVSSSLLTEVNAVGEPDRNKAQDGTIGDRAHAQSASDHNLDEIGNTGSSSDADGTPEVHARDVDARGPWKIKGGAERIVQLIVADTRARRYAKRRVKYVIFRGRIWVWRQIDGVWTFVQQAYTGVDQHVEHFHVSFGYGSGSGASNPENNTAPWGILSAYQEESDDMQEADWTRLAKLLDDVQRGAGPAVAAGAGMPQHFAGDNVRRWDGAGNEVPLTDDNPWMSAAYTLGYLGRVQANQSRALAALAASLSGISADVDESAIIAGILAGLTPEKIAAAIPAELGSQVADILAARLSD